MRKKNQAKDDLTFSSLVARIGEINSKCTSQAKIAVNISLTIRNWLIGYYIFEYEQKGSDRAGYAQHLLGRLAEKLEILGVSRTQERELRRYRQFYLFYPQIRESVTPELITDANSIRDSLTPVSQNPLITRLSFSHIVELLNIEDETKRKFYEIEAIKGGWSVRELKRQINSLYYERTGLSKDKKKLSLSTNAAAGKSNLELTIRDPYIFEFLGLKAEEVMSESHLEHQLLDKLQSFLLELGHGFCFEARQKRIVIGEQHFYVDLVFYHRILKCHVLVELKLAEFNHENIGQLNTYVSWFKKNMMTAGDNPPVGILLCSNKNHALVEYALAGLDTKLFVSKYQLELPAKEEMQKFIEEKIRETA